MVNSLSIYNKGNLAKQGFESRIFEALKIFFIVNEPYNELLFANEDCGGSHYSYERNKEFILRTYYSILDIQNKIPSFDEISDRMNEHNEELFCNMAAIDAYEQLITYEHCSEDDIWEIYHECYDCVISSFYGFTPNLDLFAPEIERVLKEAGLALEIETDSDYFYSDIEDINIIVNSSERERDDNYKRKILYNDCQQLLYPCVTMSESESFKTNNVYHIIRY